MAKLFELGERQPSQLQYYRDKRNDWRWRIVSRNGKVLAVSSEGYKSKQDAINGHSVAFDSCQYPAAEVPK